MTHQTFDIAAYEWLASHKAVISERTLKDYRQYIAALRAYFDERLLTEIDLTALRSFQAWRLKGSDGPGPESKYKHAASPVRIKNEINCVLKPMLKEAGLWNAASERFKHLQVSREGSGCALTHEEQEQVFTVAFSRKRWHIAAHVLKIMYRTGTSFGELRRLRRGDVDLEAGTIHVVLGAKNAGARLRVIALVPSALASLRWIVARWEKLGGSSQSDFLLPHRCGLDAHDFTRPMTSINAAWVAIRAEWVSRYGVTTKKKLRIYDARVTVASALLSNPSLSLPTIERTLGWTPSSAMRKRYFRCDIESQRNTLATLDFTPAVVPAIIEPAPERKPSARESARDAVSKFDSALKITPLMERLRQRVGLPLFLLPASRGGDK